MLRCSRFRPARSSFEVLPFSTGVYTDWAPDAIADQLAYDVALVELSQRLGIEVDLTRFGQPRQERDRLEQALISRGIHLDEFEAPAEFREQPQRAWGKR